MDHSGTKAACERSVRTVGPRGAANRRSGWRLALTAVIAGGGIGIGCASPGDGAGNWGVGQGRDVITRPQIAGTRAQHAYDAVEILRPGWLSNRGAISVADPGPRYPDVSIDGVVVGGLDELRRIHAAEVRLIRFLEPGRAAMKYGQDHVRGVIEVITVKG